MRRFAGIAGVVYDLDGTIIDSADVHADAWREAGQRYGVTISANFLEFQKGKTNETAAEHLLTEAGKTDIKLSDFVDAKIEYANNHANESSFFDDFTVAYQRLAEKGIPVWICTSSPEAFCRNVYSHFEPLKDFVERTIWREKYYPKEKPVGLAMAFKAMDVEPNKGVYIGDAPSDWVAALGAGCGFVCFRTPSIEWHWELLSVLS